MTAWHEHPVLLLYWVALKKDMPLRMWADMMIGSYAENGLEPPIAEAVRLIDEYGVKDEILQRKLHNKP